MKQGGDGGATSSSASSSSQIIPNLGLNELNLQQKGQTDYFFSNKVLCFACKQYGHYADTCSQIQQIKQYRCQKKRREEKEKLKFSEKDLSSGTHSNSEYQFSQLKYGGESSRGAVPALSN